MFGIYKLLEWWNDLKFLWLFWLAKIILFNVTGKTFPGAQRLASLRLQLEGSSAMRTTSAGSEYQNFSIKTGTTTIQQYKEILFN